MFNKIQSLEQAKYMLDDAVNSIEAWFKKNTQLLPAEIIQAEHNLKNIKRYLDLEMEKESKKVEGFIHPGIGFTQPGHKDVRSWRERQW